MQNAPRRPLLIAGIVILLIICVLVFAVPRLLGGLLGGGGSSASELRLGQFVTALNIDNNGCPQDPTSQFLPDEIIFAALETSSLPAGTELFARLSQEGQPVEDTNTLSVDRATQACVYFQFEPIGTYPPGNYTVDLFVNGNQADRVALEVVPDASGGQAPPLAGGDTGGAQLGRLYTTTAVDQNGCPTDDAAEFFPEETVYAAYQTSFIPAGTELFARLTFEGQPVEDTNTVGVDQDVEACVWFEFEPLGDGFDPGEYTVEIYINGNFVEEIGFTVR